MSASPKSRTTPKARRFSPHFIRRLSSWLVLSTSLVLGLGKAMMVKSEAAGTFYWDADGNITGDSLTTGVGLGGNGTWDPTSAFWWDGSSGALTAWPNTGTDTAVFTGAGGQVQLTAPLSVGTLTFNVAGFNITGDGTAGSNTLTLGGTTPSIQVNVAGTDSINAVLTGSNGLNLSSTTTGTLALTGSNLFSGAVTISSGTLAINADSGLGNAANSVVFNGSTAAGLLLNLPTVLNANRTLILNNTGGAVATLSSSGANQVILGQVTGAGTLAVSNGATTYLLNATNNNSGILWAQNGTVSVNNLPDAAGDGNIKLGNGGSTGTFQWGTGATGPLVLNSRAIELAGSTGGGTVDSSSPTAANSITINTNLAFTTASSGNKTLTLTGINTGTNTFAGAITNNGTSTTGLTKSGLDLWVLTNSGNNYSGTLTVNQGTLRITDPSGLGATGSWSFGGSSNGQGFDIRVDSAPTGIRSMTNNSANNSYIFVDHSAVAGDTTTGQTITFGTIAQVNGTASITFVGDHGYGIVMGLNTLAANGTAATNNPFTIANDLGSPGLTGYTLGSAESITISGFTTSGGANTGGVTQTLSGWGNYVINGPISSPVVSGGLPLNITKSGGGFLTFGPSLTLSGWTAGTLTLSGGTTRFTNSMATAGATVTMNTAVLELRNDASTNFGFNLANVLSATSTLVIDHSVGGTASGQTATIGTITAGTTNAVLEVVGDHGYGLTTGAVTINSGISFTINNLVGAPGYSAAGYVPGTITLGSVTDAANVTGTITLAGFGDFAPFNGNVSSSGTGTLNITKTAQGVTTFSGDNSAWALGTLTANGGTTLIDATNANALGAASLNGTAGLLEILSATGASTASWTNRALTLTSTFTLDMDPLTGSSATGQSVALGGITAVAGTAFLDSNHGYNLTFNGTATQGATSVSLINIGNGLVTYAGNFTSTAATSTYTFGGNGNSVISGNILDGTGKTAIAKNGPGILVLSGAGSSFTGALTLNAGVIQITNAGALGGTSPAPSSFLGNQPGWVGLDLRNNGSMDLSNRTVGRTYGTVFNVDNNGSGTNGTMTMGGGAAGLGLQDNGWSFVATAGNGYSLKFGSAAPINVGATAGGVAYTVWNYIPSVSGTGDLEFAGGVTFINTASNGILTLGGTGDYLLSGTLNYTTGGTSDTVTKSGLGTVTLSANSSTTWNNAAAIYTATNGITRATNAGSLGGASSKFNLNGGALDLRSNAGFTLTTPVTVGGTNSYINVDAAVGSTGTTATTDNLSGLSIGTFTLFITGGTQSGANAYNLNTGTTTVTAANAVIVNNISNGGTLTIPSLTGANFAAAFSGSGATTISAATIGTGSLTKSGTGTVTLTEAGTANTTGNLVINAGTLVADYTSGATNTIFSTADTLTLAGGALQIKGATTGNTTQTLGAITVNSGGLGQITLTPQGTGTTTLITGALTATAGGGGLLVNSPANTAVQINTAMNTPTTINGRSVFFDGTNYNWLANTGANTTSVGYSAYSVGISAGNNSLVTDNTIGTAATINSLKITDTTTGQSLTLGGNKVILTNGGLLFTGANDYAINATSGGGLSSGIATNADFIINQYGAGALTVNAPILHGAGTDTLTINGTGKVVLGGSLGPNLNTYTGTTFLNGGTLQMANATQLGAGTGQGLTINAGTFDLNGNTGFSIGAFNGGYPAVVDNTSATPVIFTIGAAGGAGTYLGTIQNTGGAISVVKAGTGTMTLGDVNGMSKLAFTGDLSITGNGVLNVAVPLTDTAGSKINLGTPSAGETPTFTYVGGTNLVLNGRQFDLSGVSGAAITASGVNGVSGTPGVIVVNSALLMDGTGAKTLTLNGTTGALSPGEAAVSGLSGSGAVATINQFNGVIGNASGGGALTLAIGGTGGWSIGGNNSFTGGVILNGTADIVRATNANSFGGSANTISVTGTPILDFRNDSSTNFGNPVSMSSSFTINVDRAPGGDGYSQVMTLGQLTEAVTGKTLTVTNQVGVGANNNGSNPIDNYGLHLANGLLLNGATGTTTITNALGNNGAATMAVPAPGTGVAGALVIDGITTGTSLGAQTLAITTPSNSSSVTIISGDIVQSTGTTLAINDTSAGTVTLANQTAATNFTGGLTINAGNAIVRATTASSLGSSANPIALTAGTLEIRNDASVSFGNAITWTGASNTQLTVGESLNGTSGRNNTFSFGTLSLGAGAGKALVVGGIANNINGAQSASSDNSGDSVTFSGVVLTGSTASSLTITNSLALPGILNLGNLTNTFTTTASTETLTIGGTGVTTLGNASNAVSNGLTAINYNGTGILDLSTATLANTYSGGLTLSAGTTRVTNQYGLGAPTNLVNFVGGQLELRSDTNVSYSNPMVLNAIGTGSLAVGQLPGGTNVNGGVGVMFTLGQLKVGTGTKTFAVNGINGSLGTSEDSVTLGGVDLNGITGGTTITNNLQLPGVLNVGNVTSNAAQASTISLSFAGSGTTTLGDVTNGLATAVAITNANVTILDLSRMTAATNYSGGFTAAGGTTRVTNPFDFGTAPGISLQSGTIEIRSDTNFTYTGALNFNANTNSVVIAVGEVGTGTTTGVGSTFTFGALTFTVASGKTLTFGGIANTGANSSDSVVVNGVTFGAGNLSNSISNNLSLPGTLSLGNVTGAGTSGTVTLTVSGNGFTTMGDITNGAGGGVTALTYNGTGILQVTGSGASNFSGGITISGNGTLRMVGAASFGSNGTYPITLSGGTVGTGTLDIRTDSNMSLSNPLTFSTNGVTLNLDQATPGNLSKTVSFTGPASVLGASAKALTLTSGSNDGFNFVNGFSDPVTGWTITNNASGAANLGPLTYTSATAGSLTLNGSGATTTGNISNTGAGAVSIVYSGTGLLDLTGNNATTGAMTGLSISGSAGLVKVTAPANLGTANDTVTFSSTTAATLQIRSDNGGASNGVISFGNNITFNGAAATLAVLDVGNNGGSAVTNNRVAFGSLANSGAANVGTLTVNGQNGYSVSFTGVGLPNGTGNTTNLVANVPVTINGNVTNAMTGFATGNFDTIVLDGTAVNAINGTISDATGAGLSAGGATKVTKQGAGTWILNPGVSGNNYIGATTVLAGTLQSGSNNAISAANASGLSISPSAGSATSQVTATVDLAGFNQALGEGTGTLSGILNAALVMGGASAFSQAILTNSSGTSTVTLAGATGTNGDVQYVSTSNPLEAIISVTNLSFGAASRTFNIGDSTTAPIDMLITSNMTDGGGGFVKKGAGFLQMTNTSSVISGPVDLQSGTVSTAFAFTDNAQTFTFGNSTNATTLQWIGTTGMTFNTRVLTLNGTTGALTLDNSGVSNGSNAVVFKQPLVFGTSNSGAKTLTLTGTNTDNNLIGALSDNTATSPTSVTKTGAGKWGLAGNSAITGTFAVSAGQFDLNTHNFSTGAMTLTTAGASITGTTGVLTSTSYAVSNASGGTLISAILGGTGAFTKTGLGSVTLSGANTFTGNISDTAGNIVITNSQGLGVGPKTVSIIPSTNPTTLPGLALDGSGGSITLASNISFTTSFDALNTGVPIPLNAAIINIAGNNTIQGNFSLTSGGGGTAFLSEAGNLTISGNISATTTLRTVLFRGASTGVVSGVISDGTNPLTVGHDDGTGTWTLSGANTYTAGTTISTGGIRLGGGNNRLPTAGTVTLGSGTTSGKLIIGGDAAGGSGVGTQITQLLTQSTATSILSTSGTGTNNAVVGGSDGGTSAGTPANNSVLNLNIGTGFTDAYTGLIGGTGTFENNINLVKSGGGTLVLSTDLSAWTGIQSDTPNTGLSGDATRPTLTVSGGALQLNPGTVINTVILNTGGVINDLGATYGNNALIITSGGLIALSNTGDSFENSGITSTSHGVVALNIPGNTGVTDFAGSDVYFGAIGDRIFSGTTLNVGSGATYRLGGGAPWNALGTASIGGSGGFLELTGTNVLTGANKVIIGDNGTYNGGTGIFGGESTVQIAAPQSYTGITILAGGSLVVSNLNELGNPTTPAGSIVLDGGIFRYSGITNDISNLLTIDSGGTIDTNGQNVTFSSGIGNSTTGTKGVGTGGLSKIGNGTLTLAAVNTYTGPTDVYSGSLVVDLNAAAANNVLASTSTLALDGGSFGVKGTGGTTTRSQIFATTSFNSGNSTITPTLNAASTTANVLNLSLGNLTRSNGATGNIVFTTGNTTTTNTQITQSSIATANTLITDVNGVAYLTFGTSATSIRDWAVTGATASQIVQAPATGFYTAATATTATGNADIGALSPTVTESAGNNVITSIRFDNAGARTLTLNGATSTVSVGGILVTSNVGNNATTIAGSATLQGANGGVGDLTIFNYDTSNSLTISEPIGGTGGLTKSGTGTVILGATNTYSGQTVINGGVLSIGNSVQYGTTTGFTLNGGTLLWTSAAALPKVFTLGLNGGTLNIASAGNENIGTAGDNLLFLGLGSRTLTLIGGADRKQVFNFVIGDNGGPTNLAINGSSNTSYVSLNANNTYTGTTTINGGILQVTTAGSLPGGLGGTPATPTNSGGGNLIFAATSTSRAVLELTAASGGFTRPLGTGIDQVQWTGNGGFSNAGTGVLVVNLGGASAGVTWGSGNFVPNTSILDFGQSAGNSLTSGGSIDFQNPINLGNAVRTIDVSNGIANNSTGVDGILSGALTGTTGGGLTKTGAGVLKLTANNSAGTDANAPVTVSGGFLVLANSSATDLSALPGAGATNRNLTISSNGTVILTGQADPTALLNRVALTSTGSVSLDTNSNATIDLSSFASLALGSYSDIGGTPVYFGGTLSPNSTTYRIADASLISGSAAGPAASSVQDAVNILVLSRENQFTDNGATARSVNYGGGEFYLTEPNTYTGGTVIQGNSTAGSSQIGIGSDSAFGTGLISANPTTGSLGYVGALNGDHTLSNNVTLGQTGNFVIAGNTANRGIANFGAMTYLGTINLPSSVSFFSEGNANAIVLGDLKPTGASTAITLSANSGGMFNILSDVNGAVVKTYTSMTINNGVALTIDDDRSLGAVPATPTANNLVFGTTGTAGTATLQVFPGTSSVSLSANRLITVTNNTTNVTTPAFNVPGGPVTGNSTLTIPGVISGSTTGQINKLGLGTLILQGTNTATSTNANGLQVFAGTLELDYSNLVGAGPILASQTLTLGTSSNNSLSNGGTLLINAGATAAAETFSNVASTAKDNFITLNSAGGVITLGLGSTLTQASGGTLNFSGTGLATAVVHSSATGANGIIPGATWGGTDLVGANGTSLVQYTGYTATSGTSTAPTISSATATNVRVTNGTSNNITLAATGTISINTLTFNDPTAGGRTIDVRNGSTAGTLNFGTVGMILDAAGAQALTIGIAGTAGTINAGGSTTNTSGQLILANESSNLMTVNSVIANNGTGVTTLVKTGPGTVTLAGNNTFTGSVFVNNGVLTFSDGGVSKSLGNATVAATNIIMNGGTLRYTGTANNTLIFGTTFNSISTIDVPNTTGTNALTMGTTTALSSVIGVNGVDGILQKTGAGTLTMGGSVDDSNLSVEVLAGTFNLGKSSSSSVHSVGGAGNAGLIVDAGATARITGTGGDQVADATSVLVKSGGIFDLNGNSEVIDGLAGSGTASVTNASATLSSLTLGGSAASTNNESDIGSNTIAAAAAGVASTGLNNFGGVISGNIALTKFGAGLQVLGGNNTYSSATTITAGTLRLAVTNALPSGTGKGDVTIVGNTTINAVVVPGTLDLGGFNQAINGLNSTTGGFVTNTIPLVWNGSAWTATSGTNTLTLGNNNATGTFNGVFQDGFTVIPNAGAGAGTGVSGVLALAKNGTGLETLTGANTATGALTVNAGELDLNTTGANAWSGNVVVAGGMLKLLQNNQIADIRLLTVSGGTFEMDGSTETVAGVSLTGGTIQDTPTGGALTSTTAFDLESGTASAVLSGSVGANKTATGTVTLSNANTYTGVTTISGGVLIAANASALGTADGTAGTGTVVQSGGTLELANSVSIGNEALTLNGSGAGGAAGALTTDGSTVVYAGAVTVASNATINANGGTITFTGGISKDNTTLTLTGGGTINIGILSSGQPGLSGPTSFTSDLIVDGTTVNENVANTYAGPTTIRNGGILNVNVAGALPTSPRTTITMDDLGAGGSKLVMSAFNEGAQSLSSPNTAAGQSSSVVIGAGATGIQFNVGTASGTTTFNGVISGTTASTFVKDGNSTQILAGQSTFGGAINVTSGTLQAGTSTTTNVSGAPVSGAFGVDAPMTVTATLELAGFNNTVGSLAGSSGGAFVQNSTGGPATLTVDGTNASPVTYNGVIQDGGAGNALSVVKNGSGTQVLTGANTYLGDTAVKGGKLVVSGSLVGKVNVSTGATFASGANFTTQIGGLTATSDASGGGNVAPGDIGGSNLSSVGQMNVAGNVSLGTLSTLGVAHLTMEIGGNNDGSAGGNKTDTLQYDRLAISNSGTLSLNNVNLDLSAVNSFTFTNPSTGGSGFNLDGHIYFLITGATSVVGTFANDSHGVSNPLLPGFSTIVGAGGQMFAISYSANFATDKFTGGNDVAVMAIPEPNSLSLLASSLGIALGLQRMRRRRKA